MVRHPLSNFGCPPGVEGLLRVGRTPTTVPSLAPRDLYTQPRVLTPDQTSLPRSVTIGTLLVSSTSPDPFERYPLTHSPRPLTLSRQSFPPSFWGLTAPVSRKRVHTLCPWMYTCTCVYVCLRGCVYVSTRVCRVVHVCRCLVRVRLVCVVCVRVSVCMYEHGVLCKRTDLIHVCTCVHTCTYTHVRVFCGYAWVHMPGNVRVDVRVYMCTTHVRVRTDLHP